MTFYYMTTDENGVECVDELATDNGVWDVERTGKMADAYPDTIYFEYPVSESRIYPYLDGDHVVYACCESTIGPLCEHLRSKPEQEIDVSTETPVKFNNKLEELS